MPFSSALRAGNFRQSRNYAGCTTLDPIRWHSVTPCSQAANGTMPLMQLINTIRVTIRVCMRKIARLLNKLTRGRLSPDSVTIFGCLMHIPIAMLIGLRGYNIVAAMLLLVFGLFDTLDGELARLQKRESDIGGLLDASTDRMKEVMLYTGIAYAFTQTSHPSYAALAVAACGASLCVSYIKSKGETIIATKKAMNYVNANKVFRDGFLTFELRMFLLIVGLLANQLVITTAVIAVLATYTALQRLVRISRALA
jgi:CDP-diacylglycerol---glycerol-3-phosphate 3-phosphatidyltransferase